ncbi:hypothetical protein D3C78_1261090 [compost metagenome]
MRLEHFTASARTVIPFGDPRSSLNTSALRGTSLIANNMSGLAKHNAAKAKAIERAKEIAAQIWHADDNHEFRLGEVAVLVRDMLQRDDFTELPALARIKEWIKSAAPKYARKAGRPRKSP